MQFAQLAFWGAVGLDGLLLLILVTRLVIDKVSFGRQPEPLLAAQYTAVLGEKQPGQGAPEQPAVLPEIPVDVSPLLGQAAAAPQPVRSPAPVRKLNGIGGAYAGNSFELRPGKLSIGRQAADILLENDSQVSRQHAQVEVGADQLATIRDLGSTNGTWVNEERVTERTLAPGDMLRVGTSQFKVEA
jgi:hypothetical protein